MAPPNLKTAVAKYRKHHIEDVSNQVKQQRFFVKGQNDAIKEINAAAHKLKDKHKAKINKSEHNGAWRHTRYANLFQTAYERLCRLYRRRSRPRYSCVDSTLVKNVYGGLMFLVCSDSNAQ